MPLSDDTLQRYFDEDLPSTEADAVRAELETSAEDRERLRSLGKLRELLALAAADSSRHIESDELFAAVQLDLDRQQRLRVVDGARRKAHLRVFVPIAATLAVAAAALLVFQGRDDRLTQVAGIERHAPTIAAPTLTTVDAPPGTEVVEVDFGSNTGTVFAVEGESGEPIAVVWINDEPVAD